MSHVPANRRPRGTKRNLTTDTLSTEQFPPNATTAVNSGEAGQLGRGLPGWTLRGAVALVAAGILAVLMANGMAGVALGLLGLGLLLSVLMPSSPAPTLVLVLVALSVVALGSSPFTAHMLLLVPLVHLFHVCCAIAGLLPANSRVHPAALRAPAIRFAAIQAGVFALVGLLALVPSDRASAPMELAAMIGVAGIAGLLLWLLLRQR
jgi:hypothetical protein